jgi:Tol biopolymer transport system component
VWFVDRDGDTFGDRFDFVFDGVQPAGYVADSADCNDADASINPSATDVTGNGIDENCDGVDVIPTARVSLTGAQAQALGGGGSSQASAGISDDGRFVAFASGSTNLVPGDTNGVADVFVRDTVAATIERISVSTAGTEAAAASATPSISEDGRYVAFASTADNLVAGDTNTLSDIFVRDTVADTTVRVSVNSAGQQATGASTEPSISGDGRYVVFTSLAADLVVGDGNSASDVFVRDLVAGTTSRLSVDAGGADADGASSQPKIAADGRYVAFVSDATDLVTGDTNAARDVFVRDLQTSSTERVSVRSTGSQGDLSSEGPAISADGQFVSFYSLASNLVASDTNAVRDVFVRDRVASTTIRASVSSSNAQSNGGSFAFGNALSADGRYLVFWSSGSNLVTGDSNGQFDVFRRDLIAGTTIAVSVSESLALGNGLSENAVISGDGRFVVFNSLATNLAAGDTNGLRDTFQRGPLF